MTDDKLKTTGTETRLEEITESWGGDTIRLEAAIKGWKDPKSNDFFVDDEASLCKSLDGIAKALNRIADALESKETA